METKEVMSEKPKEVPQLADTTYAHMVGTIWPMYIVFMSTFNDQSIRIGCVGKFWAPLWFSLTLPLKFFNYRMLERICENSNIFYSRCNTLQPYGVRGPHEH